jgi:uncharacterized protein (DUF4415 family)
MSKLSDERVQTMLARMSKLPDPDLTDPDNPEWTAEDFAVARAEESSLSPLLQDALARGRGRPRSASAKIAVKLRLDPDIVARFKSDGPGWQTRINATLRQALDGQS